ncbi:hypothetical protein Aperf_G00000018553 [Anoplocephala perfoliata]
MESITESQNSNETSAGSLGLGAALAVAYDLQEDPNFSQSSYTHSESTSVPIASVAPQSGVLVLSKSPYYSSYPAQSQPVRYHAGDPYWAVSGCPQIPQTQQQTSLVTSSSTLPMTAYLNPIPVSSPVSCPLGPDNGSYFLQSVSQPPITSTVMTSSTGEGVSYVEGGPASESTLSTDSMLSVRSDTFPTYPPTSEMGYSIKPVPQSSIMSNNSHHNPGILNGNGTSATPSTSSSSNRRHDDQRQAAVPSSGSDDGLYELSEEDVKEIDDMLTQNPQVTSSRHWKYYIETNEWTRATCALMACLFSRDQMANSTVLGRGGSQRERLPTNLVAYVVTKMRRRFNKSAAAVRARMAQKCKDERRFGRVLPSGAIASNPDRSQPGGTSVNVAAAINSSAASGSISSRQSPAVNRRRSAAFAAGTPSLAKNPRLSVAASPAQPIPQPIQPNNPSAVLNSLPSEVYSAQSTTNPAPSTASVVHDPPVILASAPEMAS